MHRLTKGALTLGVYAVGATLVLWRLAEREFGEAIRGYVKRRRSEGDSDMNSNTSSTEPSQGETDPDDFERRVRERAYQFWEADGRPEGKADLYWHRARELLEDEGQSSMPPPQSRGNQA
jgi:hypothetical protein